jgi:hypothetical protein
MLVNFMFRKIRLKKEIKKYEKEIANIEQKRVRSQAALVEAILQNITPRDEDVDYFNNYTAQINYKRMKIQELQTELNSLKK